MSNGLKRTKDGFQFFDCVACGNEWSRIAIKGQPPKTCPECRDARTERTQTPKVEKPESKFPKRSLARIPGRHMNFPILSAYGEARKPALLVGPAGTGKTTAAAQLAEDLKLDFHTQSCSPDMTAVDFSGFVSPHGEYVATPMYSAFKHGGVFLLDEADAGSPSALVYANQVLAAVPGQRVTFPNGEHVQRHPDFVPVAGANTWGNGATRAYSGRTKLDAATLNRFGRIEWDYDEVLERGMAGDDMSEWCDYVQRVRKAAKAAKYEEPIATPRNTVNGAELLRIGLDRATVEQTQIWNGVPEDAKRTILSHM